MLTEAVGNVGVTGSAVGTTMAVLVERDHIGIFGKMNAGKSTVMNLLTQQESSIVDSQPGTTADTKVTLMEIHGIGPVKLMDTAGADEQSALGEKKRRKVFNDLKACDLIILVIDPAAAAFATEQALLDAARAADKQVLVVYNLFKPDDAGKTAHVEAALPLLRFYPKLAIAATRSEERAKLIGFIKDHYVARHAAVPLLPFLEQDRYYLLNIPMDEETPPGRYLRPQAMVEEYITRHWGWPVSFRPALARARGTDAAAAAAEKARFDAVCERLGDRLAGVITDSQAMDVMHRWVPATMPLTTFSIVMINYMSRGRMADFVRGLRGVDKLKTGDRVLIVEACNHSRIAEDIGTVQIPKAIAKRFHGVTVEHNFGREFQDNPDLARYRLVIHCGGCMIAPQALAARVRDLSQIGVPFTNYGLFLSALQGEAALRRVLKPWGLEP